MTLMTFVMSPECAAWAAGFDVGRRTAHEKHELHSELDSTRHYDRGLVAGWRLQNGLLAQPMQDDYDDAMWGTAPRATLQ